MEFGALGEFIVAHLMLGVIRVNRLGACVSLSVNLNIG